jgi:hypothetical protein
VWRNNPEDTLLHSHRRENLKSYIVFLYGFLQEPHGVTTQKTPFFIVTAVKTSNLTSFQMKNGVL